MLVNVKDAKAILCFGSRFRRLTTNVTVQSGLTTNVTELTLCSSILTCNVPINRSLNSYASDVYNRCVQTCYS